MSRVEVDGVGFAYGDTPVLRDASFEVPDGSLTALVGPSGCGKTTLLRLIAGFARPTGGSITIGDRVVAGEGFVPPHRRRVGVVPQEGALFPHLTVARNVGLGLPRRSPGSTARVDELLRLAGLDHLGDRLPRELSGGQQQRAALVRALAPRPRVVLLDEPFGSLDTEVRHRLRGSVRELLTAQGATALLVTHDRDEALSLPDRVVVVLGGAVAQAGTPQEVYTRPVSRAVAALLGEVGHLPVVADGPGAVATVMGRATTTGPAPDGPLEAVVRPEQVVAREGGAPARVESAHYTGGTTRVVVRLVDGPALPAVLPTGARVGESVTVGLLGPVHVLPVVRDAGA